MPLPAMILSFDRLT